MSEAIARTEAGRDEAHARALGRIMGENYRACLQECRENHIRYGKVSRREAAELAEKDAQNRRNPSDAHTARVHEKPLEELNWDDLETLELNEEGKGWTKWEQIQAQAKEDLISGIYGEEAVVHKSALPIRRAQYIALRDRFITEWQPRDMIEETLIEQLTQQYTMYLHWARVSSARAWGEMRQLNQWEQVYEAPRVSEQEADMHAMTMMERCHRLFLRTLRALRDMRRYAPVIIQNAGQVNMTQGPQINIAEA